MRTEKQLEFLNKAKTLSDKPKDRLGPKSKQVIESGNFIFDAHSHIFDGACVDEKYFILRCLSEVSVNVAKKVLKILYPFKNLVFDKHVDFDIYDIIYNTGNDKETAFLSFDTHDFLEQFEKNIEEEIKDDKYLLEDEKSMNSVKSFLKKIYHLVVILKSRKMLKVLETFQDHYSISNVSEATQISIVLGMDLNMGWGVGNPNLKIEKSQRQQNNELLDLVKTEAILPFFPVDPRRANLYDNFLAAFSDTGASFFGVKVYPALGYLPSDPALDPIFEICSKKNIPVLSHCGGTTVSTFLKKITVNDYGNIYDVPGDSRKEKAAYLNDADRWIPVLKKYPNLRLNLAHFGNAKHWMENRSDNKSINSIINIINEYDYVYTDFSFNLYRDEAVKNFNLKMKETPSIQSKVLFGTDFWVVLPSDDLMKSQQKFLEINHEFFNQMTTSNVLEYLGL